LSGHHMPSHSRAGATNGMMAVLRAIRAVTSMLVPRCVLALTFNICTHSRLKMQAFTEVELVAVANFLQANKYIRGYVNFHSYSQLWMSPWGYTSDKPKVRWMGRLHIVSPPLNCCTGFLHARPAVGSGSGCHRQALWHPVPTRSYCDDHLRGEVGRVHMCVLAASV
jgi:hypothetical protein